MFFNVSFIFFWEGGHCTNDWVSRGLVPDSVMRIICTSCVSDIDIKKDFLIVLEFLCKCLFYERDSKAPKFAGERLRRLVGMDSHIASSILSCQSFSADCSSLKPPNSTELISLCSTIISSFSISKEEFDSWSHHCHFGDCCLSQLELLYAHDDLPQWYLNNYGTRFNDYEAFLIVLQRCIDSNFIVDDEALQSFFNRIQTLFVHNCVVLGSKVLQLFCKLFDTTYSLLKEPCLAPCIVQSFFHALDVCHGNFDACYAVINTIMSISNNMEALEQLSQVESQFDTLMLIPERIRGRPILVTKIAELLTFLLEYSQDSERGNEESRSSLAEGIIGAVLRHPDNPILKQCPKLVAFVSDVSLN